MKILVFAKPVQGELLPFDACALECALNLSRDVTVVSMCPQKNEDLFRRLTRLGAKTVLLCDSAFAGSDTLATSYVLSLAAKKLGFDLILCGRQSIDGDTAQVGPCLSALLKIPVITNVMEIKAVTDNITCQTRLGEETVPLPALITVERINTLRFPSIRSKIDNVTVLTNADLQADIHRCGLLGSPTKVLKTYESVRGKRNCKFVGKEQFFSLIERFRYDAKQKSTAADSPVKLKEVWAVGEAVKQYAEKIAEHVRVIEKSSAEEIARMAKSEKPEVILWEADLWGRRNAPIASALLQTGLCADCTELETDGAHLIMYRPAMSGTLYAKIVCRTKPQMATVRTNSEGDGVILAGGKGVTEQKDKLFRLAKEIDASVCASRGLVDAGEMPYSAQVGLTGKTVSPNVYIAVGISGAVHHTCAIEGAKTVIAVNPDRNARIFDYADFGFVCTLEELF